ncbi:MAG: RNA-binding protein [Methanomicrobiales archaeon]|nr:RNA-binding protein [Methanomicrobiales archaeon]
MPKITIKRRYTLRKDDAAALMADLRQQLGDQADLFSGDRIEKMETDSPVTIYLIDRLPLLMRMEGWVFPTLRGAIARTFDRRRCVMDRGAIAFIAKGADAMRPGIISITDDVVAGAPVLIAEETHGKPLAVGIALADAGEIRSQSRGKAIRTVHHVGDEIWNLEI